MGSFIKTLFQGMMDWVRILVSSAWSFFNGYNGYERLNWIANHWVTLLLVLCALGLVADGLIYLIRWKPYRVWGSFFRRLGRRRDAVEKGGPEADMAEPDMMDEPVSVPELPPAEDTAAEPAREERDAGWAWENPFEIRRGEQRVLEATGARGYREPGTQESETITEQDGGVTARFEQAIRPRKRRARANAIFSDEATVQEVQAPQELIDRREAYHRPIYPRSWKGNKNQQ